LIGEAAVAYQTFCQSLAQQAIENDLPQDREQIPPGFLAAGLEMADFFIAHAPRPTLLPGQRNGFFDPRGVGESMPVTSHMQNFI